MVSPPFQKLWGSDIVERQGCPYYGGPGPLGFDERGSAQESLYFPLPLFVV